MNDELFTEEVVKNVSKSEILFFTSADTIYGIEIKYISEIISVEPITFVPKLPDYINGVLNLRGKIVPVLSLRRRFGVEEIPYDDRTCIIMLELDDGTVAGIVIDRVRGVENIDEDKIGKAPDFGSVNSNRFVKGIISIDDEVKMLLDCDKLINGKQKQQQPETA